MLCEPATLQSALDWEGSIGSARLQYLGKQSAQQIGSDVRKLAKSQIPEVPKSFFSLAARSLPFLCHLHDGHLSLRVCSYESSGRCPLPREGADEMVGIILAGAFTL